MLSFPRSLRLRLGYEKEFFRAARRRVLGAIFAWQRREARKLGIAEPLVGASSFAQRFSSNLGLYPHLHLVVPDGVFCGGSQGAVLFRALPRPSVEDLERIVARIARRVQRWLLQHALAEEPRRRVERRSREMRRGLSVAYSSAAEVRPRAGKVDSPPPRPGKLVALVEGFSLEAGRTVHENDRQGLERLCRYGQRPPLAVERLSRGADGQLVLRFKRPLADGSAEIHLSPMELLRRLAAIVPPPGFHQVGYAASRGCAARRPC